MIQVRRCQFETNSSSVHAFVLPKDNDEIKIPKSIKLYGEADPTTVEGRIRFMYELADEHGYGEDFILYLKSKGITIEDDFVEEPSSSLFSSMRLTEEQFEKVLFNPNIISENDKANYDKLIKSGNYEYINIRG